MRKMFNAIKQFFFGPFGVFPNLKVYPNKRWESKEQKEEAKRREEEACQAAIDANRRAWAEDCRIRMINKESLARQGKLKSSGSAVDYHFGH